MKDFNVTEISCGCGHCHSDKHNHTHSHSSSQHQCHCGEHNHNDVHCHNHNEERGQCDNHNHNNIDEHSHHHNHNNNTSKRETNLLIGAAVITVAAAIFHLFFDFNPIIIGIACGIATLIAGYETFIEGIKSLVKLKIDETTLLTIAVIAAFCLGEFTEAALVTVLFQFGELMEDIAVSRSRKNIQKLAQIRPDKATVISENTQQVVPAENVAVGSTILVKPYERIPLDGTIIEGSSSIDTSAITGESVPVEGTVNTSVMSGMQNGEGTIKVITTKTAENSAASRILNMVEESQKNKGQSEKFISRFAKIYTPIIIIISVLVAVVPSLIFGNFSTWLYRALVCLVASCPCAIVISVPLAYFAGIGGASKKGVMIKGGKYIDALAKADCFVFDKTGTLTTGKIRVCEVTSLGTLSQEEILSYCASAEQYSSHPIAEAIKNKAQDMGVPIKNTNNIKEKAGYGVTAIIDGKEITVGNIKLLNNEDKNKLKNISSVYLLIDGQLQGAINIADTVRKETKDVLSNLKSLGANNLVMLTGDSEEKARDIVEKTGITTYHSNLLPNEKVEYMKELRKNSSSTVFVGDGINDAPVIALADCGIAMGLGSDAAIESSDAVLSDGTLKHLPFMIKFARKIMATIKANITFALIVKAAVIVLAIAGIAPMWLGVLSDTGVSMLCILYSIRLVR